MTANSFVYISMCVFVCVCVCVCMCVCTHVWLCVYSYRVSLAYLQEPNNCVSTCVPVLSFSLNLFCFTIDK
jgi:hypothetical protein